MHSKHAQTDRVSLRIGIEMLDKKESDLYEKILKLCQKSNLCYQSKENVLFLVNERLFQELVSEKPKVRLFANNQEISIEEESE